MAYRIGAFRLDPDARLLERAGEALEVPRRVFDCLAYLVEQHARAVGRDELIERVWKRSNVSDNQLAQTVLAVRRLLDDDGAQQKLIRTVPGFGYHFVGTVELDTGVPVTPAAPASAAPRPSEQSAPTPAAPAPRRNWLSAALALVLLAGGGTALWRYWPTPAPAPAPAPPLAAPGWTWVLPARIDSGDEDWARIGVSSLIAERLRHNGAVVVPMQNVLTRFPGAAPEELGPLRRELAAGVVVAPVIARQGEAWYVELRNEGASGERRVSAVDHDLLQAARRATDQLAAPIPGADSVIEERHAVIAQLIRSRDFEAAHRQLARLPEAEIGLPETELLHIELDMEQGRHGRAWERATTLRAGLDAKRLPVVAGRLGILEADLLLHRGDAQWGAGLDTALDLLRAHGTPHDLGVVLLMRASRARIAGDYAAASADYLQARRHFLAAADEVGVATAGNGLGKVAALEGRTTEALRQMQDSVAVLARYGEVRRQFGALQWMMMAQRGLRRWSDAELTLEQMRSLQPRLSSAEERVSYLRTAAILLFSTGRLREGAALLDESEREVLGEASEETRQTTDIYRMQLELALGHHAKVAATGAERFARIRAAVGPATAPGRDQRELTLYLWFEARRRTFAEDPPAVPRLEETPAELEGPSTTFGWIARGHLLRERGEPVAAEAAYRAALRIDKEFNRLTRIADASDSLIRFLLEQGRVADAAQILSELLILDAGLPERDFDSAVLVARVRRAEGDTPGWRQAVSTAEGLAGERTIPAELLLLPPD